MKKYVPKMYKSSIFDINYDKIYDTGIRCLIFDLDNTIVAAKESIPNKKVLYLIKKLKKKFDVYILSNNSSKKRVSNVCKLLEINFISFAMKPFSFGFKRLLKKYKYSPNEVCIIGDQIMTDVLGGNNMEIFTVLVEPIDSNELKVTSVNRFFERKKIAKLEKLGMFKKGEFYG